MEQPVNTTSQIDPNSNLSISPKEEPKIGAKIIPALFIGIIVLVLGSAGTLAFQTYASAKPAKDLQKAAQGLSEVKSFEFSFAPQASNNVNLSFSGSIHREPGKLSQVTLDAGGIQGDSSHNLNIKLVGSSQEIFAQANYSKLDDALAQIKRELPIVDGLETVKMILPALSGQKWLHALLPASLLDSPKNAVASPTDAPQRVDTKAVENFFKKFQSAFVFRNSGGVFGKKIIVSLNKTKLLEALESLKQTNVELKLKDVNNLIDLVKSSSDWGKDLVEITLDGKLGLPSQIVIRMPQIDSATLKKTLEDGVSEQGYLGALKNLPLLNNLTAPKSQGLLTLGTVDITNYNSAAVVEKPTLVIEGEQVLQVAQKELMPIFGQLLMGGSSAPTLNSLPKTTVPRSKSSSSSGTSQPLVAPQYTPKPGELGSQEWLDNFNKQFQENQNRTNQVIEAQKKFCQDNPTLCQ
jgi:hypothetical protein